MNFPSASTLSVTSRVLILGTALLLPAGLHAQVILQTADASPGLEIPDGSTVGISSTLTLAPNILEITQVTVEISISGGFTGDFYAYLQHDTGLSILLNRTGRSAGDSIGYLDNGFDITLDDAAVNGDVHVYQTVSNPGGGTLNGVWAPDGRATSPFTVNGTENRDATLAVFNGLASGGDWTLFIADLSTGGVGTLDHWALNVTGVAVPEPHHWAGVTAAALLGFAWFRRRRG